MATIIYPSPIFGPINSRRLGVSLGINLQPADGKTCTFDCIYCECGFNKDHLPKLARPTRRQVADALEQKLKEMDQQGTSPDVLTFAGNGEPTGHPHFAEIIDDTIQLRDRYFPKAKITVLSNSTFINHKAVRDALMKIDNNILKLDTVDSEYIKKVDRPSGKSYNVQQIVDDMRLFNGHVVIQTMFMKGITADGFNVDNTGPEFVEPWLEAVKKIAPMKVMIYTIDRETPERGLVKATHADLDSICDRVEACGIKCTASY